MKFEEYSNRDELTDLENKIKTLSPESKFNRYCMDGDRVSSVELSILEKGNKKIIKELIGIGFTKKQKRRYKPEGYIECPMAYPDCYELIMVKSFN